MLVSEKSRVQVDFLVVMKMLNHYQKAAGDEEVMGTLLGLIDMNKKQKVASERIEVTNCFPYPPVNEDELSRYQSDIVEYCKRIGQDFFQVGWYHSGKFGSIFQRSFIESCYDFQQYIPSGVVLVFDPHKTASGLLTIKAYRLSDKAMRLMDQKDFSIANVLEHGVVPDDLFEELPVELKTSRLSCVALADLKLRMTPEPRSWNVLNLPSSSDLEKNLQLMCSSMDQMIIECRKYNNYLVNYKERVRAQKKLDPTRDESTIAKNIRAPSRLDSLILSRQINEFCGQMNGLAMQNFSKLSMSESLQTSAAESHTQNP